MADARASIDEELDALRNAERWRAVHTYDAPVGRVVVSRESGGRRKLHNWASNDYLGGTQDLKVGNETRRALRAWGSGAGAARLLSGSLGCHRRLEQRLAHWLECDSALVTGSGYQANIGIITAVASNRSDAVVLDRACHASTYDAAELAAGERHRFRHNDVEDLAATLSKLPADTRRVLVCVESVYSMDGDEAPLAAIAACCQQHGALLLVDEAHAIGVYGPGGRGLAAELQVPVDITVGTLSKSLAAQGGFIAGEQRFIDLMINRGRSFIYSTALAPAACGAAVGMLNRLRKAPELPDTLRQRSCELRARLRAAVAPAGWQVPDGRGPIIPVIIGDDATTLAVADALRTTGHLCPAIRPPTVPEGQARLRLSLTTAHTASDQGRLVKALTRIAAEHEQG